MTDILWFVGVLAPALIAGLAYYCGYRRGVLTALGRYQNAQLAPSMDRALVKQQALDQEHKARTLKAEILTNSRQK